MTRETVQRRVGETLIRREEIARRVRDMGAEIARDLREALDAEGSSPEAPDRVVLIPVMTGAMVFAADLIRHMPVTMATRLVSISSYLGASTASKGARMETDLPDDLADRHVVIVDDILDTGQTLGLLQRLIAEKSPASVRTCVLLSKLVERLAPASAEYVGFEIPNEFVVGYGLDYDGHYRNLPDIVTLETVD